MRVLLDESACDANAVCVSVAAEVFALDDDDRLVIATDPDERLLPLIEQAVRSCPKLALTLSDQ